LFGCVQQAPGRSSDARLNGRNRVILKRSSLLSLFLIVAIGLVATKTYWLWKAGPWDLPNSRKAKMPIAVEDKPIANAARIIGTETIISKNIFDPERGAGLTREVEANSQAFQRIRGMVLLGTAILGNNRFAILQDGARSAGAPVTPGQSGVPMRIKLGDTVEGFRLSEISEKRVVFAKGTATVEVPLDYFRKTDGVQPRGSVAAQTNPPGQAATPGVVAPRVATPGQPNVPGQTVPRVRRDREPAAGE
jgi:hypothetical protein